MFATQKKFHHLFRILKYRHSYRVVPCFKFNFERRTMMLLCGNLFYLAPGHLKPSVTKKRIKKKQFSIIILGD